MREPAIVWLQTGDLRTSDNPALHHVGGWASEGRPVIPVFIWDGKAGATASSAQGMGAASRCWLHHDLAALHKKLRELGSRLTLRRAQAGVVDELLRLVDETGASSVYWNGGSRPEMSAQDARLFDALHERGIGRISFECNRILSPSIILSKSGKPSQVFTPFYKSMLAYLADRETGGTDLLEPLGEIDRLTAPTDTAGHEQWPQSLELDELGLRTGGVWQDRLIQHWQPGEVGAHGRLASFLAADGAARYAEQRDLPGLPGTSRLSPHLHFGNISAREVWNACRTAEQSGSSDAFVRQLVWRESAHHLLQHFPHTVDQPLREEFNRFPWAQPVGAGDTPELLAWKRGQTGYPIVDAAMRELWATGWMHNRCRMIAASFLCKHLLIPWQEGAAWFWDTLVDADLANNTLGWQWVAGCGADAAPYFRIFNPVLQGQKFDPQGAYVRRWCPELAALPDKLIHAPWTASPLELASAGISLVNSLQHADKLPAHKVGPLPRPGTYPLPIVDHAFVRDRALAAYARMKNRG